MPAPSGLQPSGIYIRQLPHGMHGITKNMHCSVYISLTDDMQCICCSCNTGMRALPEIYARQPEPEAGLRAYISGKVRILRVTSIMQHLSGKLGDQSESQKPTLLHHRYKALLYL